MPDLKLGPLPKQDSSKLTLTLSKPLRDALELYVLDYVAAYGPAELNELAPMMLEAFLRSDKAFMKRHTESIRANAASLPQPLPSAANGAAVATAGVHRRRTQSVETASSTS